MDNLKKKEKIKGKYDSTSYFYDERYKEIQFEKYKKIIHKRDIKNKIILDAGCGTGLILEYFQKTPYSSDQIDFKYVGVDISIEMIMILKKKLKEMKVNTSRNLDLILADIENLPFRMNTFSLLISFTSFQNLPDMRRGINQSIMTLRNKSLMFISILKKKFDKDTLISILGKKVKVIKIVDEKGIEDFLITAKKD